VNTTIDRVSPEVAVLALDGELDASNYRELIETGGGLYADGARCLVLDLGRLSYMSSSGIVALHSLALVFRGQQPPDPEAGWSAFHAVGSDTDEGTAADQVRLVAPTPAIDSILERTGLKRILPVYADRDAAIAG
jgi:anti-anti-sigma regulatory factor